MPNYVASQQISPSSMYIEKFLVSLPVLLTLLACLIIGLIYAIYRILEIDEALLVNLNSRREPRVRIAPELPSYATRDSRSPRDGEETDSEDDDEEEEDEDEEDDEEGDSEVTEEQQEGWLEELLRPLVALFKDGTLFDMHERERARSESTRKTDKKDSHTQSKVSTTKTRVHIVRKSNSSTNKHQVPPNSDRSTERVFHTGKTRCPSTETSVGADELAVRGDVTRIPIKILPTSIEVIVTFRQAGECSCGCFVPKRCANATRCACVERCPCRSEPLKSVSDETSLELSRNLNHILALQLRSQATDHQVLIGQLGNLLGQLRTEVGHQCCRKCDAAEPFPSTRPDHITQPSHQKFCCENGGRCSSGNRSCERKLGQCISGMEPDRRNAEPAHRRMEPVNCPQGKDMNQVTSEEALREATHAPKTTKLQCSCPNTLTPHVMPIAGDQYNTYDPIVD